MNKKYHMKQEIINRLEYKEETYAGELETWYDPVNGDYFHIPIEIVRDWDNSEVIGNDKGPGQLDAKNMTPTERYRFRKHIPFWKYM